MVESVLLMIVYLLDSLFSWSSSGSTILGVTGDFATLKKDSFDKDFFQEKINDVGFFFIK